MSERIKQIEVIKAIFEKAKHAPRSEEGWFDDLDLHGDLGSALYNVGDKKLFELKNEVYSYLKDPFADFRAEAVQTLGWDTGLNLKEFQKNEAYKIWLNDPNEDVKIAALVAWTRFYAFTKNPVILKNLYHIFSSEQYACDIRAHALKGFMNVSDATLYPGEGMDILRLGELENQKDVTKSMDWGKINRLMQQHVPGWKK